MVLCIGNGQYNNINVFDRYYTQSFRYVCPVLFIKVHWEPCMIVSCNYVHNEYCAVIQAQQIVTQQPLMPDTNVTFIHRHADECQVLFYSKNSNDDCGERILTTKCSLLQNSCNLNYCHNKYPYGKGTYYWTDGFTCITEYGKLEQPRLFLGGSDR